MIRPIICVNVFWHLWPPCLCNHRACAITFCTLFRVINSYQFYCQQSTVSVSVLRACARALSLSLFRVNNSYQLYC